MRKRWIAFIIIVLALCAILLVLYNVKAPVLELNDDCVVMEYSFVSVDDMILSTENVKSMKIIAGSSPSLEESLEISDDGQKVFVAGYLDGPYVITIEAVGVTGKIVKKEVMVHTYQEPAVPENYEW